MEIERIIGILGETKGKELILRRHLESASSIAKGIRYYIIEMWELDTPDPIVKARVLGQYTLEHRDEIKSQCEEEFMRELFSVL